MLCTALEYPVWELGYFCFLPEYTENFAERAKKRQNCNGKRKKPLLVAGLQQQGQRGNWYISEVNPRFGGGYPHAWACGVRVPEMIVRNLEGQTNVPEIGNYPVGKIMMKYNEIMVR